MGTNDEYDVMFVSNRLTFIYAFRQSKKYESQKWSELLVGDIVKVSCNDVSFAPSLHPLVYCLYCCCAVLLVLWSFVFPY